MKRRGSREFLQDPWQQAEQAGMSQSRDSTAAALGQQLMAASESSSLLCSPFPSFLACFCCAVLPWPLPNPAVSSVSSPTHRKTTCLFFSCWLFHSFCELKHLTGLFGNCLEPAQGKLKGEGGKEGGSAWSTE